MSLTGTLRRHLLISDIQTLLDSNFSLITSCTFELSEIFALFRALQIVLNYIANAFHMCSLLSHNCPLPLLCVLQTNTIDFYKEGAFHRASYV